MNETFGTRLRLQRERQQIDLAAISASTKINITWLERLERDDVEHWPVGIFRRAYVRAYAAAIGLDPETVLREFLERHPDPTPLDPFTAAEAQAAEEAARPPGNRFGKIVRSAMAAMPGFMQRPSRPELAGMRLAIDSADDRESVDHGESLEPARGVVSRRDNVGPAVPTRFEPAAVEAPAAPAPVAEDRRIPAVATANTDAASDHVSAGRYQSGHAGTYEQRLQASAPQRREPDLIAAAALSTRFAQVREWNEVDVLLGEVARVLDAIGLVVWSHTGHGDALVAVLAHGYPPAVIARMPVVPRTADNAIAAAFRSAHRSIVASEHGRPGALVVPLLAATGCVGVLALELADCNEQRDVVVAFAEIVGAQLAPLLGAASAAEAVSA